MSEICLNMSEFNSTLAIAFTYFYLRFYVIVKALRKILNYLTKKKNRNQEKNF